LVLYDPSIEALTPLPCEIAVRRYNLL